MNENGIYIGNECSDDVKYYVKLYSIIRLLLILLFIANFEVFLDLLKNKKFINKIFMDKIKLYNINY